MPNAIRTREDFVKLVNGYDGAVAYWDHHLGHLLDTLADLGILDDTAIIVTSDHCECLGENGCYGDHPMANEASHHVPMVLRWPGVTTGLAEEQRHVGGLEYSIDLCPTICDLLGIPGPPGQATKAGRSFAPGVLGEHFSGRDHLVLSHGSYSLQRAVRTPEHLYVKTLHSGCWRLEHEQLYAIEDDPHMANDLIGTDAGTARHLAGLLDYWREENLSLSGPTPDPMEARRYEVPADAFSVPRYLERMRRTGRAHLASDLEGRLAQEWVTGQVWKRP
jgi:arylsulfatase A-like enzyme